MRRIIKSKTKARARRAARARAQVFGTAAKPRLAVSRSLQNVYLQLIDDERGQTLVGLSSQALGKKVEAPNRQGKAAVAYVAGQALAKQALEMGIKEVCFDRRGFLYHGRVAAVAEGARDAGLKF